VSDSRVSYSQDLLDDAAQPSDIPIDATQPTLGAAQESSPSNAAWTVQVETEDSDDPSDTGYDSEPSANSQATGGDGVETGPIPIPRSTCRLYLANGNICGGPAGKCGRPSHARLRLTRALAPPG
jgi:hypothetical protein